jgi:hypothetical protein
MSGRGWGRLARALGALAVLSVLGGCGRSARPMVATPPLLTVPVESAATTTPLAATRPAFGVTTAPSSIPPPSVAALTAAAAGDAVRAALAGEVGLAPESVAIDAVEPGRWPNDCLGLPLPGEVCRPGPISGYRVVLRIAGEPYPYRIDGTGALLRAEPAPRLTADEVLLLWTREDAGGCAMAMIAATRAEFGPCSGSTLRGALTIAQRETLRGWVERYAPFEAMTELGFVQLMGRGGDPASPEALLELAAWASQLGLALLGGG